jgi:NAD-dependent SIR2 family protein deacetylase
MPCSRADVDALARFVERHPRIFALTGAGCSTDSGIPDYRDADGAWKHRPPIYYQEFVGRESARRRYWARSLIGWERLARARPNPAHHALARLEACGVVRILVTQNVDGLHQQAGSRAVIDLHGRLETIACLGCGERTARGDLQVRLRALNPDRARTSAAAGPDGDALLDQACDDFRVPSCESCGGLLKPAVVFFGE